MVQRYSTKTVSSRYADRGVGKCYTRKKSGDGIYRIDEGYSLKEVKREPESSEIRVRDRERMICRPVQPGNSAELTLKPPCTAIIPPAGT